MLRCRYWKTNLTGFWIFATLALNSVGNRSRRSTKIGSTRTVRRRSNSGRTRYTKGCVIGRLYLLYTVYFLYYRLFNKCVSFLVKYYHFIYDLLSKFRKILMVAREAQTSELTEKIIKNLKPKSVKQTSMVRGLDLGLKLWNFEHCS